MGGGIWKKVLYSSLILTPVVSSYEAGAFVYVSAVCIFLFCKYVIKGEKSTKGQWLREGLWFAAPLALAVVWRIIIGLLLIWIYGLSYHANGDSEIEWFTGSPLETLRKVFVEDAGAYVVRALVYPPITLFVFAAILFFIGILVLSVKRHSALPLILGVIILASLFFQSIVQGLGMPYRTAQTIDLFTAFVVASLVVRCLRFKRKEIRLGVVIVGLFLCLHSGLYSGQLLALNNQRSDNEMAVVHQLGTKLLSEFEEKPVVFVGRYDSGQWISDRVEFDKDSLNGKLYMTLYEKYSGRSGEDNKLPRSNVNSHLNWASTAFSQKYLGELFSFCGYDITLLELDSAKEIKSYNQIAAQEGIKPFEIRDMGDYIFVCIGEIKVSE